MDDTADLKITQGKSVAEPAASKTDVTLVFLGKSGKPHQWTAAGDTVAKSLVPAGGGKTQLLSVYHGLDFQEGHETTDTAFVFTKELKDIRVTAWDTVRSSCVPQLTGLSRLTLQRTPSFARTDRRPARRSDDAHVHAAGPRRRRRV
jgi:hypothetical protein